MLYSTAVIGVGEQFQSAHDAMVAIAVVDRLRRSDIPATVLLSTAPPQPERLVELWAASPLAVVIEPLALIRARPGVVRRCELDGRGRPYADWPETEGLGAAVRLAVDLDRLPGRLVAYTVEVSEYSFLWRMSAQIDAVADRLVGLVRAEVPEYWPVLPSRVPVLGAALPVKAATAVAGRPPGD